MKINKDADLTILLDYGWESHLGGEQGCYYKNFDSTENADIALVINSKEVNYPFVINSYYTESIGGFRGCDDSCVDMFEVLREVEVLKELDILI